jgi:hypothetical protein
MEKIQVESRGEAVEGMQQDTEGAWNKYNTCTD